MIAGNLPDYSVLMSCYAKDKALFLDQAIESMSSQTVAFHDLVLVCDGPVSNDLDSVIARWMHRLGTRMHVERRPDNEGLGVALNAGVQLCECDIIARMDADDISRPDRMEKLLTKMNTEKLDLVGGAIEEFDKNPGDMGAVRMPPLLQSDIDMWLKGRNPFNHMSVIFDRHVVEKAGGYQPFPWMEDYWLWVRMIAMGCRCANISDVVVDVRVGEGMYARRSSIAYLRSQIRFFDGMRKLGLVGWFGQVKAILQRTLITIVPARLVKVAYNKMLRVEVER